MTSTRNKGKRNAKKPIIKLNTKKLKSHVVDPPAPEIEQDAMEIDDANENMESDQCDASAIVDLALIDKPFKNPNFKSKFKKGKNLKQILAIERAELATRSNSVCHYTAIEAPPSLLPAKKYCDITGLVAKYTDPKTQLRYCNLEVYHFIQTLSPSRIQDYLSLRQAQNKM